MKIEYIKYIREYLSKTREYLGVADFSIANSFDRRCIYGISKKNIMLTDVNSVYVINGCHLIDEFMISTLSNVSKLINADAMIDDIRRYILNLDRLSIVNESDVLTDEQMYFYQKLLNDNIHSYYDDDNQVLVGLKDDAWGVVYVPKKNSTNCR